MAKPEVPYSPAAVLVVDDDLINRKLVVGGLRTAGFSEIHEAEDGLVAKEYLTEHTVDVVITDVMMPRLDGLALIRWARQRQPETVWIILSGLDTFDAAVEAIHLGAFDFLAKPPNLKRLEVSLRNALAHRQLREEKEALHHDLEKRVLQLEGLCRILGDQAEQISQDLRRAEVIQSALLPQNPPEMRGLSVHSLYRPGHFVGGDLYDVITLDEDRVAVYIADASGHGVSAAMLSVLFKQRLRTTTASGAAIPPATVLAEINGELFRDVAAPGMFVTAIYCIVDSQRGILEVASAGHPPARVVRADGETLLLERTGPALGLHANAVFEETRVDLGAGDRLFLYSDGLIESTPDAPSEGDTSSDSDPASQRDFLMDVLREGLGTSEPDATSAPTSALLNQLLDRSLAASEGERDDVTMVLVDVKDGPSHFDNGSGEVRSEAQRPAHPSGSLTHGELRESTVISVQGRGTYLQSHVFFDAVQSVIEARRGLILDLASCDYLDSTFLGMIHEMVAEGDRASTPVHVQRVGESVRSLFEELSMALVLRHVREPAESLPRMQPLVNAAPDENTLHRRILRAHDVLASLSEENRAKFQDVVDSLKRELGDTHPAAPRRRPPS